MYRIVATFPKFWQLPILAITNSPPSPSHRGTRYGIAKIAMIADCQNQPQLSNIQELAKGLNPVRRSSTFFSILAITNFGNYQFPPSPSHRGTSSNGSHFGSAHGHARKKSQSPSHRGTSSNAIEQPISHAPHTTVSIPFASGNFFQRMPPIKEPSC